MTTLTEEIEALRLAMAETYEHELFQAARLAAHVEAHDVALFREIVAITDRHGDMRAQTVDALITLARRIGHVPRLAPPADLEPALPDDQVPLPRWHGLDEDMFEPAVDRSLAS